MPPSESNAPPCVIHEDEHLLVVNKPAGWNTHAPGPYAGEGIYDWLRHREPRWSRLAIIHRLDKETSGVMVFGKTPLANRSLTEQFAGRHVQKRYVFLTDRPVKERQLTVRSKIARVGDRYTSSAQGEFAETRFRVLGPKVKSPNATLVEAQPLTGRTHQIRVHAAERGFPILGDVLYGGSQFTRVCLHAAELNLNHPSTGQPAIFRAPVEFESDPRLSLRHGIVDPQDTNALRLIHGASDGWSGWYVDQLGEFLLSQSAAALRDGQKAELVRLAKLVYARAAYHKILTRDARGAAKVEASPRPAFGEEAPTRFVVLENGRQFELSFNEGYSVGLFLDQRDNRRRLLTGHVGADFKLPPRGSRLEMLNTFAYTCGFSVCAALAGAKTISLDLSRRYLEWGKRNFSLNGLDPGAHEFIFGDVFDWLRRFARKACAFDVVVLDPPTFSQSKDHGPFRAEKDYGKLVALTLPLIKPGGILFAATNAARWRPQDFLTVLRQVIRAGGRKILQEQYFPQPPDFPINRAEPAYLKTIWVRIQ
jgi:23S rRNA (cytosine1962-C5)-methyltransferase